MERFKTIAAIVIVVMSVSDLCRADDASSSLKPEMIVHFTQGTLACLSKDDLQEATEHAIAGEKTKVEAMMVENGGSCLMLSPNQRMKIIHVEYNNPDLPDLGLVEIVGEGITAANGAWAFSIGAEPVTSKHKKN